MTITTYTVIYAVHSRRTSDPLILISTSSRLAATLPIPLEVFMKDKLPTFYESVEQRNKATCN